MAAEAVPSLLSDVGTRSSDAMVDLLLRDICILFWHKADKLCVLGIIEQLCPNWIRMGSFCPQFWEAAGLFIDKKKKLYQLTKQKFCVAKL